MVLLKLASCEEEAVGVAGRHGHGRQDLLMLEIDEVIDKVEASSGTTSFWDQGHVPGDLSSSSWNAGTASNGRRLSATTHVSSFEHGFDGWNMTEGAEPFRRHSGQTTSPFTGPLNASDGSYYVYAETRSVDRQQGGMFVYISYAPPPLSAHLLATSFQPPTILDPPTSYPYLFEDVFYSMWRDFRGNIRSVSFDYHRHGEAFNGFRLEGSTDGEEYAILWSKPASGGDQGWAWQSGGWQPLIAYKRIP